MNLGSVVADFRADRHGTNEIHCTGLHLYKLWYVLMKYSWSNCRVQIKHEALVSADYIKLTHNTFEIHKRQLIDKLVDSWVKNIHTRQDVAFIRNIDTVYIIILNYQANNVQYMLQVYFSPSESWNYINNWGFHWLTNTAQIHCTGHNSWLLTMIGAGGVERSFALGRLCIWWSNRRGSVARRCKSC